MSAAARCVHCGRPFAPWRPAGVLALRCGEVVVWREDPGVGAVVERDVCGECGAVAQAASEAECEWLMARRGAALGNGRER